MSTVTYIAKNTEHDAKKAVDALSKYNIFIASDRDNYLIIGTIEMIISEIGSFGYKVEYVTSGDDYKELTACELYSDNEEIWTLNKPNYPQ